MHNNEIFKKVIWVELITVTGLSKTSFLIIEVSNKEMVLVSAL